MMSMSILRLETDVSSDLVCSADCTLVNLEDCLQKLADDRALDTLMSDEVESANDARRARFLHVPEKDAPIPRTDPRNDVDAGPRNGAAILDVVRRSAVDMEGPLPTEFRQDARMFS